MWDRVATGVFWAIAVFVVAVLGAIIVHFVLASLGTISLGFLTSDPSRTELGGVAPILWNSVYILVLTMLITVPLGTIGGIYMAEYAGDGRVPNFIRLCQELISSVPSIVVGLFGLALFVIAFGWSFSALSGALALTVFNLPLMMRLAEQAMRAVPRRRTRREPGSGRHQVADDPPRRPAAGHPRHRHRHHPDLGAHLRRGCSADLHRGPVHTIELRLQQPEHHRPALAVEPVP